MGSRGRLLFDLNEPPAEDNEESDSVVSLQPQKALLSTSLLEPPEVLAVAAGTQGTVNNHVFQHAPSGSGFQPFTRPKYVHGSEGNAEQKEASDRIPNNASLRMSSNNEDVKAVPALVSTAADALSVEREEGEWSDADGSADAQESGSLREQGKASQELENSGAVASSSAPDVKVSESLKDESSSSRNSDNNVKGHMTMDCQEEPGLVLKQEKVKSIEASRALKGAINPVKRKMDHHNEAKLGKKRSRQTMFLNLEDVKQAGPIKSSTPRRQSIPASITTRTMKDVRTVSPPAGPPPTDRIGETQPQPAIKDQKHPDVLCSEGGLAGDSSESKSESNGDINYGSARLKRQNGDMDSSADVLPPIPRQSSWKQPTDMRLPKNSQVVNRKPVTQSSMDSKMGTKKPTPAKKQMTVSNMYQDTSVERLIREVTNEKFWHNPGETDLQCVPDRFESVEDYVRVFEPLLFEECRAQLYSTWEESTEGVSSNAHTMVRVRSIERRERGWYDVILLPANESNKWTFKEGDVAVLSTPRPGLVRTRRKNSSTEDVEEPEISGRVAGTVRRHIPIDTRDPSGAILHFYVGDTYESNSLVDDDHILRKLQPKGTWFLTVLGSLATTQREYVALHAFRRLNVQMQAAILQPSPEHFPKYEQQSPAMPECFTPNFVDHLHRSFNGPQLSAIQWAAVHTASGTSGGKRQDPWPFTLVQGPPGTGKTHTVWGMLNVIHLVQYQQYYTSLLKKLAPESYKQNTESNTDNVATGSIDEVLQSMDKNLFRTLPKLCPKPRMLVCAPSNAATDELLSRVLDRGFIDGEMKVYRPDVARVGVDSQTRAAQAVSVERRTEQLLVKNRDEVFGYMHQLRSREAQLSMQIATLQRELTVAAAAVRSQGSVGVDPDVLVARDQNRDALLQNLAAAVESRDKTLVELSRLFILEGKFRASSNFNLEEARANLEASFANEAEIVFTTVSSSGRKLFSRLSHGFDMVVIDEAAQASEVGVLPPLALGAARCVLVGDPQQLPATVISKAAGTLLYSRSLFERFQQANCPTMLLSVQYRMHPQIRDFPSRYFYQGRLSDSESVANLPDETYYKDPLLKPYVFYDITHGRESHRGGSVSYQNIHEAQFCVRLYEHLQKTAKSLGLGKISVGIITPYKLQLKCLQREFDEALKSEEGKDLYINTVDAFQGQERDVIIMSCVRASGHGVGFVADIRRMNVALTRARRALWVMGNANALMQSEDWAALIKDAKARNCYMDMENLPKEFLGPKGPSYNPLPGKLSSNMRGLRSAGPRHRSLDMRMDSRSGTPSEDDEKFNAPVISRNGHYRPMRPQFENSLDDFDQSGDKSRDAWQNGIQKKQSPAGVVGKREI
ncbi:uncharacterized ATP-dependent helicase C29A10.10c-like isoform X2 [Argentina anserina]|uniref:uncharacterized ATP-dependent helicase C29A10.10c-like isoform X2 n=1 Tax=Argentina anserina TaxID=57926 RepID=UPI0021765D07|nr:uncharacterized ATP-dependent helicase C29A10.10c-like isoform X2 [Potentilla anserina]